MKKKYTINRNDFLYQSLIEKMREGVIKVDKNFIIEYCNPVLCEIFGYNLEDILGKPLDQFLDTSNRDIVNEQFEKRKIGHSDPYEIEFMTHDNQLMYASVVPHPIFNKKGEFDGSFSVLSDITKLKITEKKLKKSQARYRVITENIPSVIWNMDKSGSINYISSNSDKVLGFSPEEVNKGGALFWMENVHPDDQERLVRLFESLFVAEKKENVEFRFCKQDGSVIWLHALANIVQKEDGDYEAFGVITDITKNKENELALKLNEEKLKVILNNHFQLTGLLSVDGKVLDVNNTALEFIGAEKHDIINQFIWDTPWWNHSEQLQCDLKNAINVAAKGELVHFEAFHYSYRGDKRIIDFTIKPVKSEGKVLYLVPQGHDITVQRKITQSLYESKKRYQILFETASDGIVLIKGDRFIDCNKKALEIFECDRDQFIGKTPMDFSPMYQPDGRLSQDIIRQNLAIALQGKSGLIEWTHVTMTGNIILCEIRQNCIEIDAEKYIQVFIRDITEEKRAEQELIESEEKYRNLIELANDGIVIVQDSVVKFVNKSMQLLIGYNAQEIMGKPFKRYIYADDIPHALEQYKKRITGELTTEVAHLRMVDKQHKILDVELNSARIQLQGRPAVFVYIRNVTDRLKMQEKLSFSEKLSTIGELSRKVAHEIGNPLSSILHSASELGDTLALQGDEKVLMDIILKETKRLDEIIKNFLNFSRPKNPVFQKTDLAKIIHELLLVIQNDTNFKGKHIEIHKDISETIPPIKADQDMIKEVLWNLLLNARDAITEKGAISIFLGTVWMNGKESIELSIKDTGAGIPEKSLGKIFEPYFTSKFSGSGLGLATVKKNIAEHDGVIMVHSKLNHGSEFIIHLPVGGSEKN